MRNCAPHAHQKLAQQNNMGGGEAKIPFNDAQEKETTMVTKRR